MKKFVFFCVVFAFSVFSQVDDSIFPLFNTISLKEFNNKISEFQKKKIYRKLKNNLNIIRVMSFNMLFNVRENEEKEKHYWKHRQYRIVEYINFVSPDIICTQELFYDQIEDLLKYIGEEYAFYGEGRVDRKKKGSLEAIFYKKSRFQIIDSKTYAISENENIFGKFNALTFCKFIDLFTKKTFSVFNTHLDYRDVNQRFYEAKKIKQIISKTNRKEPVILTGDFNTFPMRYDKELPFYDGSFIEGLLTASILRDSMRKSLLGHLGPLSTTTYSDKKKQSFCSVGSCGIILDHIFVNSKVEVKIHGVDPARVNQEFPSDHLPVIADIFLP